MRLSIDEMDSSSVQVDLFSEQQVSRLGNFQNNRETLLERDNLGWNVENGRLFHKFFFGGSGEHALQFVADPNAVTEPARSNDSAILKTKCKFEIQLVRWFNGID